MSVEVAFTAHEVEAISSAAPTDGAHDVIEAWQESGRPLAVVSDNGAAAICVYLDLSVVLTLIDFVSARSSPDAALLKPSSDLLGLAAAALHGSPGECVRLLATLSDIQAAHRAEVRSIGGANKLGKLGRLAEADADAVTEVLGGLVGVS